MSKKLPRWSVTGVVERVVLGVGLVVAVAGWVLMVARFVEIAVEAPRFIAGYLAVVAVVAIVSLAYRFGARALGERRLRQDRSGVNWPGRPSWVPEDVARGLVLLGSGIVVGGGGVVLAVDGFGHGFGFFEHLGLGLPGVAFGMFSLPAGVEHFRARKQRLKDGRERASWALIRRYAARAGRHEDDGLRELLRALADPGVVGPVALAELRRCPGLLDGLSYHGRRGDLAAELRPFVDVATAAARGRGRRLPWRHPRPELGLSAALASVDRDGYAREAAVAAMAADPCPGYAWLLAERAVDPVEPVRARAVAALEALVAADPQTYAPMVRQAAVRLAGRRWAAALLALADLDPQGPPVQRFFPCCRRWAGKPCTPVRLAEKACRVGAARGSGGVVRGPA